MLVDTHISTAKYLTYLLENRFRIFGFRFGLDPLLGLAPWVGDIISTLLALYILWIGAKVHVPQDKLAVMFRNIMVDFFIGLVPVIGDVTDFVYKSNSKNLEIILKHRRDFIEADIVESTFQQS